MVMSPLYHRSMRLALELQLVVFGLVTVGEHLAVTAGEGFGTAGQDTKSRSKTGGGEMR